MKSNFTKEFWLGFILGLIVPIIGFVLVSVGFSLQQNRGALEIFNTAFSNDDLMANLIKLALIFNLLPFYFFMRKNKLRQCYGVIFSSLVYAFFLVFKFLI